MVEIVEYKVWMLRWQCQVTILFTPEGMFYSIPEICDVLGITDARQQREQLQSRRSTRTYVKEWPMQTKRGKRMRWCIARGVLAFWLAIINENRIREEFRDGLVEFHLEIIRASDQIFHGVVDGSIDDLPPEQMIADPNKILPFKRLGPTNEPINMRDDDE